MGVSTERRMTSMNDVFVLFCLTHWLHFNHYGTVASEQRGLSQPLDSCTTKSPCFYE